MIANTFSSGQNNKKLCQFIQCIQQNDLKALKKMVKSKLGNNLKLVQSGILIAFQNGNSEGLKSLMNSPLEDLFDDEVNLLHCVVLTSKVEFLRILMSDKRVDINRVVGETDGRTPLMVACTSGKVEMVKELLKHPKIDVNAQDEIREWFALCYALHMGTPAMVQLLLNHKNISHSSIQESLLMGLSAVSFEHFPIDLELLNMLIKKNFENEFNLKNLTNGRFEYHEHLQSWIAEELETKIREEYYNGKKDVSEESVCNRAFSVSFDVLQASILKCGCLQCSNVKDIKRKMYWYGSIDSSDESTILAKSKAKSNHTSSKKITEANCIVKRHVLDKTKSNEVKCDFITSPLPAIFKHILFDGGYEKAIDEIIDGTKTVSELGVEVQKNKPKNIDDRANKNDNNINVSKMPNSKSELNFDTLCWRCSETNVKLYKCGGCRKARYCSRQCITNDWEEHMNFCIKVQEKRSKKQKCIKEN